MFVNGVNGAKFGWKDPKQHAFFHLANFLLAIQISLMTAIIHMYTSISIDSCKLQTIYDVKVKFSRCG